jgi:cob(I)alamin adenosyltransferase
MSVYTKGGDGGKTSLISNKRVLKSSKVIWAIGEIDELNSYLGVIRSELDDDDLNAKLKEVQKDLFFIGSILAGGKLSFDKRRVKELEKEIDDLEAILPVQTKFLFPTGTKVASMLFLARSIARRAERRVVGLEKNITRDVLVYVNRLSDYLFILARYENFKKRAKEDYWEV